MLYEDFLNEPSKINKDICEFLNIRIKSNKFIGNKKTRSKKLFTGSYQRKIKSLEFIKKNKILLTIFQIKKYMPKFLVSILKELTSKIQKSLIIRFLYFKLFNFDNIFYNNQEFQLIKKYYDFSNTELLKSLDIDLKNFEYNKQYLNQ